MKERFITELQKTFQYWVEAEFGLSETREEVITQNEIEEALNAQGEKRLWL